MSRISLGPVMDFSNRTNIGGFPEGLALPKGPYGIYRFGTEYLGLNIETPITFGNVAFQDDGIHLSRY
jgi:hypothetical protein